MATFVITPDVKLLLDPGVAHGMRRLLPHPREAGALIRGGRKILARAQEAQVLTISHYHFDHYIPSFEHWMNFASPELADRLYRGKEVLLKSRDSAINFSQRKRSFYLYRRRDCVLNPADGQRFRYGSTEVRFSEPVDHGEAGTKLGKVLICTISTAHERFVFAPDVQGPMVESTLEYLLQEEPDALYIGGPPTYLARARPEGLEKARESLRVLAERVPLLIVDHHLLRDPDWRSFLEPAYAAAEAKGHELLCAAEFLGLEPQTYEAQREELYRREPPPPDWEAQLKAMRYGI